MKKRRSGLRVFRCVLTESYETNIAAKSKREALGLVEEYGGKESFKRSERVEETDLPLDMADNWYEEQK